MANQIQIKATVRSEQGNIVIDAGTIPDDLERAEQFVSVYCCTYRPDRRELRRRRAMGGDLGG